MALREYICIDAENYHDKASWEAWGRKIYETSPGQAVEQFAELELCAAYDWDDDEGDNCRVLVKTVSTGEINCFVVEGQTQVVFDISPAPTFSPPKE